MIRQIKPSLIERELIAMVNHLVGVTQGDIFAAGDQALLGSAATAFARDVSGRDVALTLIGL